MNSYEEAFLFGFVDGMDKVARDIVDTPKQIKEEMASRGWKKPGVKTPGYGAGFKEKLLARLERGGQKVFGRQGWANVRGAAGKYGLPVGAGAVGLAGGAGLMALLRKKSKEKEAS